MALRRFARRNLIAAACHIFAVSIRWHAPYIISLIECAGKLTLVKNCTVILRPGQGPLRHLKAHSRRWDLNASRPTLRRAVINTCDSSICATRRAD